MWWSEEEGPGSGGVVVRGYVLGWGLGVADDAARELPAHLHSHVIRGLGEWYTLQIQVKGLRLKRVR